MLLLRNENGKENSFCYVIFISMKVNEAGMMYGK